jgi:RNA polymerase sigma-70 factor (ECF subfamily)
LLFTEINSTNEKDLIKLLATGSEPAFEELYRLYSHRLIRYLIKMVKSETLAAEILQETFIKIWSCRENLNPELSFRSYLFRIAENLVYDLFRKTARNKKLANVLIKESFAYSHVEESFFIKENNKFLREAIESLPAKRREVFQMVKIEKRSYEEVSRVLNVSTSTINDHIVKATKAVLERLERFHVIEHGILSFGLLLYLFFR